MGNNEKSTGKARAVSSVTIGIITILFAIFIAPIILLYAVAIIGIILGAFALKTDSGKMARTGIIINIIALGCIFVSAFWLSSVLNFASGY